MDNSDFQLQTPSDPRLAVHATSPLPTWLWSADGERVMWANPVGARLFGASNCAELVQKTFAPIDHHRRQVARLAYRLSLNGAVRLERLRGFGASLGMLMTCACARLEFPDDSHGILITALGTIGRNLSLPQFIDTREAPDFHDLSEALCEQLREHTLKRDEFGQVAGQVTHQITQIVAQTEPCETQTADAARQEKSEKEKSETKPDAQAPELNVKAEAAIEATSQPTDPGNAVDTSPIDTPPNVVPFRPTGEPRAPVLTHVENNAFNELARQLSQRLERETDNAAAKAETAAPKMELAAAAPPRSNDAYGRSLLDLLSTGILIYRPDRLLHATPAFLACLGYPNLRALEDAGGIDALQIKPDVNSGISPEAGQSVTISANKPTEAPAAGGVIKARLHDIDWDGTPAMALICAPPRSVPALAETTTASTEETKLEPRYEAEQANASDAAAILDTLAEGVIMFDARGNIHACNRGAEALFGYDREKLQQHNLATLFAPESQDAVADYLDSLKTSDITSLLEPSRDVLGRESKGGLIPLAITVGRTRPESSNFFAVFRDLSQSRKGESELKQAKLLADRVADAKADLLAHLSQEIRAPLNAIIDLAERMSERRSAFNLSSPGNEHHGTYMQDIRASGERVISIVDELLELSQLETGKLDLTFANLNLNDLIETCAAVMQPQANRERIIIRTSLAQALPPINADMRAMRQIVMNLIGNSIRLAGAGSQIPGGKAAGGQVIVSTALTDSGDIALRIRDSEHGVGTNNRLETNRLETNRLQTNRLGTKETAAAMDPLRTLQQGTSERDASASSSLSLIKALVEANRAQFNIKRATNSGTLIEVVFSPARE